MQILTKPFYYNKQIIYSFIEKKVLNYQYYIKYLYCYKEINYIDTPTNQIKKKNYSKKFEFKYKIEIKSSDIYFDTFSAIEYIEDDFLYKKFKYITPGFTLKLKEKYFSNLKISKYDFIEKYFSFKKSTDYLKLTLKSLNKLSIKKIKYKNLIPLKPIKGGYITFGFGFIGFLPKTQIIYKKKKLFNIIKNKIFYIFPLISFFKSLLSISWFFKRKKSKLKYFTKLYLIFLKK